MHYDGTHETFTPTVAKEAHERVTDLWREDEARARQYGHCIINVSPRTSQAYRDAIAMWVYASQMERSEVSA